MPLSLPLPTQLPENDIAQYVPLLLSAVEGFLQLQDVWSEADYATGFQYMESLKRWLVENIPHVSDIPIGMVAPFTKGNGTVPAKWLWADGSVISRTTYAALFAVIGTQYGAGNGETTFKIPDLRGTFIQGITIQTSAQMGAQGGAATKTLSVANLPAHHHAQRMRNGNNMLLAGGATNRFSVTSTNEFNLTTPIDTGDTGSGTGFDNLPPYTDLSYGIYAGV